MKTSFLTLAAAALLLAGCSKEELTENVTEGVSLVATSTNRNARFGNPENQPNVWFNENQGRMQVKYNGIRTLPENCRPTGRITYIIAGGENPDGGSGAETVVIEAELQRIGNSKLFRSARNTFNFAPEAYFSLVDVTIDWDFNDSYPQDESIYEGQLFLYPSGRTVAQAPKVGRIRTRLVTNFDSARELILVIADDPISHVAGVKFVQSPSFEDPNDPTAVTEHESVALQQTHFNQALGLSRWTGGSLSGIGASSVSGALYLNSGNTYNVDFLSKEVSAQIIGKYNVIVNEDGEVSSELSDEPEILGSRLGSTSFGEQWQLVIAIADLGDWVKTVNYVFTHGEGPSPLVSELPLQLTRTEGNLRIYTSAKFSFNGNPTGFNYDGIVYYFGIGTRMTASQANNKAELL